VVVQLGKQTVAVNFRPTNSRYLFRFVPDAKSRTGIAIAAREIEHHAGGTASAADYAAAGISDMAEALAVAAAKEMF